MTGSEGGGPDRGEENNRHGADSGEPVMREVDRLPLPDALKIAVSLHKDGRLDWASQIYDRILAAVPNHPDALHFKGVLAHQMGRREEAITLIRGALEQVPDHIDAWNNLGNVYKESGREDDARDAYARVLRARPRHPDANCNMAALFSAAGKIKPAMAHLRTALDADPEHTEALYNLSLVMNRIGEYDRAAEIARKALTLGRDLPGTYENMASSLHRAGRMDEAVEALRLWLRRDPGNAMAEHLLVAYLGETAPDRASDDYVTQTFDKFAVTFDTVLKALHYKAPELVAEALAAARPGDAPLHEVLDAGCGTGLCAPLVRDRADRLTGVDLSGKMIDRARQRDLYDDLHEAELTAFLAGVQRRYDAIICADTLVYFGRLDEVMAAAFGALKPGGAFVFTVEHWSGADTDGEYLLHPTGRYVHSQGYVQSCAAGAGLTVDAVSQAPLRMENGKPVEGLVVATTRPAG